MSGHGIVPGGALEVHGGTRKRVREECADGEVPSTAGSSGQDGCLAHPDSATTGCLQLGVGFLSEQFHHCFGLRRTSFFHLRTKLRDPPLHREEAQELPVPKEVVS